VAVEIMTVAMRKSTLRQTTKTPAMGPGRRRGHVKALVRLRPDQLKELRAEALKRAVASGAVRVDVSEVLREAVDAWLTRRGGAAKDKEKKAADAERNWWNKLKDDPER
jgi:hypothetical protein